VAVTATDLERSTRWYSELLAAGPVLDEAARLDELGIAHGEIAHAHYGSGLSFRDPDGIALEFFAPPA
jgi:catechol 2,3-dioxygenase-like lactoylglutathione lyase family enzyme